MARPAKRLDLARELYESGDVDRAARLVRSEHQHAVKRNDQESIAAVDDLREQMRAHLDGRELARFDGLAGTGPDGRGHPDDDIDVSPIGFWLAIAGAVAITVAVFLPLASVATFQRIENNTLIQAGDGWVFLALAVGELGAVYRAFRGRRRTWGPLVSGLLTIGLAVYEGRSSSLRYCSVVLKSSCAQGSPDIGLYLAGVGGGLLALGGWYLRTARPAPTSSVGPVAPVASRATMRCPDCAEDVLTEARVCKHCGYRFEPVGAAVHP